jgi:hypothetical protein
MLTAKSALPLLVLSLTVVPPPALADTIYLEATFDDKPLDTPIDTGGAELGEPIYVDFAVIATVRGTPMASPCLELRDNDDLVSEAADFEFIGSAEITTGILAISCNLWFHALAPGYSSYFFVREQGSAAEVFANLRCHPDGSIRHSDENSTWMLIGFYEIGRAYPVSLVFDLDAGTYDVWLDGLLVLDDEDHGITGRGVGSVLFGCSDDPDLEGRFSVERPGQEHLHTGRASDLGGDQGTLPLGDRNSVTEPLALSTLGGGGTRGEAEQPVEILSRHLAIASSLASFAVLGNASHERRPPRCYLVPCS